MTDPDRRKEIATGLFIFVLLFGGFGLGEFSLRLVNYVRFGTARSVDTAAPDSNAGPFAIDPATGITRPRPGFSGGSVSIDELGFRSPPLARPKPASRIRLAFVGTSTTYDLYAGSNETTWPHLTWRRLQTMMPGCQFDYANAGIVGLALSQFGSVLDRYVAPIAPDVIILAPPGINIEARQVALNQGLLRGQANKPDLLARTSVLWQTLEVNAAMLERQRAANLPEGKLHIDPKEFAAGFERRLEGDVRLAQNIAGLVVLIGESGRLQRTQSPRERRAAASDDIYEMPFLTIDDMLDLRDALDAAIARVAARTGALFVPQTIPAENDYWADSKHFREPASRLLAELVARALADAEPFRGLLEQRAGSCGVGS